MIKVLFAAPDDKWDVYRAPLTRACAAAGLSVDIARDHAPGCVDYIVYAPRGAPLEFRRFTRARAVLCLWAGVETIIDNPDLTQPVARMVDDGMTEGMVEYVTGHVLRHHLGMDRDITRTDRRWQPHTPPLARNRTVGILGLGALGAACAAALAGLNFRVLGWSRRQKHFAGVTCFAGDDGLARLLEQAQILCLLLPLTASTENLLDRRNLARLPRGAVIINPARGPMIDDDALLDALATGQIAHATLDVFRHEPLPPQHPFWQHPGITVTPHIASETRAETAAQVVAENIRRAEAGETLLHLVDRAAGY